MSSFLWKLNRLRAMDVHEILHRIWSSLKTRLEERGCFLASPTSPIGEYASAFFADLQITIDASSYRNVADHVLAGRFDVFALREVNLGFPPRWNRDPKTGTEAPLTFGKTLDYRDERIVGDIKYLWEPNRHTELVTLAQAWYLTGEARYAEGCRVLLDSWFDQCPYPLGVNWTSSLELSVRLVNWAVAWGLLSATPVGRSAPRDPGSLSALEEKGRWEDKTEDGVFTGSEGAAFQQRWLDSIYRHLYFISGHLSSYSSANNHLFGEYMGLFVGSIMWPMWPACAGWRDLAGAGLEAEAFKQNAPDGVNREQGIWYHHEVADMMLLCGLFGRANGVAFSAAYWSRLEAMLEFIAALMDVDGHVPMFGDSDDAVMVRWLPTPSPLPVVIETTAAQAQISSGQPETGFNVYRSLLATGAILFQRANFKEKAGSLDDKTIWLLGAGARAAFDQLDFAPPPKSVHGKMDGDTLLETSPAGGVVRRAFPEGGYYLLGEGFETTVEVRIVADVGPLGYLSIAAHGHADALSLTLSASGRELLIDSGTYAYHTQRKWRDYFRGTSAHNTVRVDGVDQSVAGGNFLWVKHATARCEAFETAAVRDILVGSHDGYRRLKDPVTHRRQLVYDKADRMLTVTDTLDCRFAHAVEVFWHFAESCTVDIVGREVVASSMGVVVKMAMSGVDWLPEKLVGRDEPPLGWISRRFDEKVPTTTVVWRGQVSGATSFETVMRLELEMAPRTTIDSHSVSRC